MKYVNEHHLDVVRTVLEHLILKSSSDANNLFVINSSVNKFTNLQIESEINQQQQIDTIDAKTDSVRRRRDEYTHRNV